MDRILDFRKTRFITSAPDLSRLPPDQGIEIAFAGRSNAGKSSAINAICDHSGLTKTSRTPGRTQLINLFEIEPGYYLVDLPGYGYAQVPEATRRRWQQSMAVYLQRRSALRALVVAMDIRHPLREHDCQLLTWAAAANLPALLLLTKADKLSASARRSTMERLGTELSAFGGSFTLQAFSATRHLGIAESRELLSSWYMQFHPAAPAAGEGAQ